MVVDARAGRAGLEGWCLCFVVATEGEVGCELDVEVRLECEVA